MLLHQMNLQTFKLSRHTDVKKNRKDSLGHMEEKHGTSSRLLSNHGNLLASAVHTVASKRKACVQGTENEQGQRLSKVPSLAPKRPHPLTFPFSTRLASESGNQSQSLLASAALPFSQLQLLLPRTPTTEAVAKANTRAASHKLSTLTPSPDPSSNVMVRAPQWPRVWRVPG